MRLTAFTARCNRPWWYTHRSAYSGHTYRSCGSQAGAFCAEWDYIPIHSGIFPCRWGVCGLVFFCSHFKPQRTFSLQNISTARKNPSHFTTRFFSLLGDILQKSKIIARMLFSKTGAQEAIGYKILWNRKQIRCTYNGKMSVSALRPIRSFLLLGESTKPYFWIFFELRRKLLIKIAFWSII